MSNIFDDLPQNDHNIPLDQAAAMTALFRANREQILQLQYQGQDILPVCESFNRAIFDSLLALSSCVGIRIYYGMSDDLKVHAVLVGIDSTDADILPVDGETGLIGEVGFPCPPICPPSSPLNGF